MASYPTACRSFAGAWIEIMLFLQVEYRFPVAPSQERGLKSASRRAHTWTRPVAPSQERGLKLYFCVDLLNVLFVAPSQERGLKYKKMGTKYAIETSLLRRSVD